MSWDGRSSLFIYIPNIILPARTCTDMPSISRTCPMWKAATLCWPPLRESSVMTCTTKQGASCTTQSPKHCTTAPMHSRLPRCNASVDDLTWPSGLPLSPHASDSIQTHPTRPGRTHFEGTEGGVIGCVSDAHHRALLAVLRLARDLSSLCSTTDPYTLPSSGHRSLGFIPFGTRPSSPPCVPP